MGNQPGHPEDFLRVVETSITSVGVLARIVTDPAQSQRLGELISKHNFPGLIRALTSSGGVRFEPNFFPDWIRDAGGYFPKFAQVLSVRADLIDDPQVLHGFSRCQEEMPSRPERAVFDHLRRQGWSEESCAGLGSSLNAGTVAQVNQITLNGTAAVVKVSWPDTRRKFVNDFRLFAHARQILQALKLNDEKALIVAAMFDAVAKSEGSVMAEFDLRREARTLQMAATLCAQEWDASYRAWQMEMQPLLQSAASQPGRNIPPQMALLATVALQQSQGWRVRVPEPAEGHVTELSLAMTRAGGQSLKELLDAGPAGQQEAAMVLVGYAVPFMGWLLLCKSSSHMAHVDPHPGNFRWDSAAQTLWVLDWGSQVQLTEERRRSFCMLISLIACNGEDGLIADMARSFGVSGETDQQVARIIRGMLNASSEEAAQDAIGFAAQDSMLKDISGDVVPVIRCLAILGGTLKAMQQKLCAEHGQRVPLSLATLWAPFAAAGLA